MDVMQKVNPFKSSTQVKVNVTKRYLLMQMLKLIFIFAFRCQLQSAKLLPQSH